jgi:ferredoxin-NADP reductase/nitrite reductase/ring-hydroxylating ferredoxin subunit
LIETLRQRTIALHGIRIHMSGCPSSCAQHFTADIGLKGVRVRRLIGTREGFDVYLGGGVAGDVHLGLRYRLGVDVDQLPLVIEEVVKEHYLRHRPGQTFSAYWRERLRESEATKVGEHDYEVSTWICERCDYRHRGEDPPVFCPGCAGLRRLFARLEADVAIQDPPAGSPAAREDGFVFAATVETVREGVGTAVDVEGHPYALFHIDGAVHAVDGLCPHEGGPLAEGTVANGIVTCPWHGWTFDARTGCSIAPGRDLQRHETRVEDGRIYLKRRTSTAERARDASPPARPARPATASLPVVEVRDETPDVRTFRLDNTLGRIPHTYPGTFARVCVRIDGVDVWRSFTISSSPTDGAFLDLTIKRNVAGQVTNHLFDIVGPGSSLTIQGAQGGFFFDPEGHTEPLVLISAGSGITPVMSIARYLAAAAPAHPCTFIHGARTVDDVIFLAECRHLHDTLPFFNYHVTLSRPDSSWDGGRGRLDAARVSSIVGDASAHRYFLCGPPAFMQTFQHWLERTGVPADRVHTERFHGADAPVRVG